MDWINNGPDRRKSLEAAFERNVLPFIPPELRSRLGLLAEMNPVVSAERAGTAAQGLLGFGATPMQRVGYAGDMLSNMAGIAAPAMVANRAGLPAAQAIEEGLLGFSQAAGVPQFMADESGALRLFHGSPHDFDKFRMDKIGTGEGAQAYGHGLYFAENEAVAQGYRDALSLDAGFSYKGREGLTREQLAEAITADYGGKYLDNIITPRGVADGVMDELIHGPSQRKFGPERAALREKLLAEIQRTDPGRMYEVQIDANPEDFLDWDKTLSEQSGKAKEYVENMRAIGADIPSGDVSGADLYKHFADAKARRNGLGFGSDGVAAANEFAREGIPGIRYLDAGSRGAGDVNELRGTVSMWERAAKKTPNDPYALQMLNDAKAQLAEAEKRLSRNYVIFDENLISIVRKYGFAGAAALLGMSEGDLVSAANAQGIDAGTGQQMALPPPRGLLE